MKVSGYASRTSLSLVVSLLVIAIGAPVGVWAQEDPDELSFESAFGSHRVVLHPSMVAVGMRPSVDAGVTSLVPVPGGAVVLGPRPPRGTARRGIELISMDREAARNRVAYVAELRRQPDVAWVESVYSLRGGLPLIPTHRVAVRFHPEISPSEMSDLLGEWGATLVRRATGDDHLLWIQPPEGMSSFVLADRCARESAVRYAEPDLLLNVSRSFIPNDQFNDNLWHFFEMSDSAVDLSEAFDLVYGMSIPAEVGPLIGVVDSGVLTDHEDLRFIGDGYDITQSAVGIEPDGVEDFHGTNVAGVIAAVGDNDMGVVGACPSCGLVGIKMELPGEISPSELFDAYQWAVDEGVAVLNNSWGNSFPWYFIPLSNTMRDAIELFSNEARGGRGGVVIFASGNGSQYAGLEEMMAFPRTLVVGASTCISRPAPYSNFGYGVDVLAPSNGHGCAIATTDVHSVSSYTAHFGGTSAAAPVVAGVIGLMLEANPDLTEAQMREGIIKSADQIDEVAAEYGDSPLIDDPDVQFSWTHAHGRVNAQRAVELAGDYGSSGCSDEFELCNGVDDDCDGTTDDEYDACNPCMMDASTRGLEVCDDSVDNDCDGSSDEEECVEPCVDWGGGCSQCNTSADCWPGQLCIALETDPNHRYCLPFCTSAFGCPEGYGCSVGSYSVCVPETGRTCQELASEVPHSSCPGWVEPSGTDSDTAFDNSGGPGGLTNDIVASGSGCGCQLAGSTVRGGLWNLLELIF